MCANVGELEVRIAVPPLRFEELPALFGAALEGEPVGGKGFLYTFPSSVPGKEVGEGLYAPDFGAMAQTYGGACARLAEAVALASAPMAACAEALRAAADAAARRAQWTALGVDAARAAELETMGIGLAALGAFRAPRLMHRMGRMPMGARARARRERKKKARR